jgi:hypothetical protein
LTVALIVKRALVNVNAISVDSVTKQNFSASVTSVTGASPLVNIGTLGTIRIRIIVALLVAVGGALINIRAGALREQGVASQLQSASITSNAKTDTSIRECAWKTHGVRLTREVRAVFLARQAAAVVASVTCASRRSRGSTGGIDVTSICATVTSRSLPNKQEESDNRGKRQNGSLHG